MVNYGYGLRQLVHESLCFSTTAQQGTADLSSSSSTCNIGEPVALTRTANTIDDLNTTPPRPVVYQSPRVPPRRSPPEQITYPSYLPGLQSLVLTSDEAIIISNPTSCSPSSSSPDSSSTVCPTSEAARPIVQLLPSPTPRSPSKIPTPLPRKTLLLPCSPPKKRPSEIPVPVRSPGSSCSISSNNSSGGPNSPIHTSSPNNCCPASPTGSVTPDSNRRAVVEVCEKVLVSRGQAQVTPFITCERYADETTGNTEVRVDEQQSTALYKKS